MSLRLRSLLPAPDLRSHVRRYVEWVEDIDGVLRRTESPYLGSPIVFMLEGDLEVDGVSGSFVAGLTDRPVTTVQSGRQRGIQVDLTPVGLAMALGHDLADLTNDLAPIPTPPFGATPTSADIDRVVRSMLSNDEPAPEEQRALELIDRGAPTVGAVAADTGWSREHLTRRLRRRFGLGAADLIRLARFGRASRRVEAGSDLASAAASAGYADQAHMTREFRRLAGVTPGRWRAMRAQITPVQDVPGRHGADWDT